MRVLRAMASAIAALIVIAACGAASASMLDVRADGSALIRGDEGMKLWMSDSARLKGSLRALTLEDIRYIPEQAFADCANLSSVRFQNGLLGIGSRAFACTAIRSVRLPATLRRVDALAFERCKALGSIRVYGPETAFADTAFKDCAGYEVAFDLPDVPVRGEGIFGVFRGARSFVVTKGLPAQWEALLGAPATRIRRAR